MDELIEDERCRCCLNSDDFATNIFECTYNGLDLHFILNKIAEIDILQESGFPQLICGSCKKSAIEAFCFRETCLASTEKLSSNNIDILVEEVIITEENIEEISGEDQQSVDDVIAVEREEEVEDLLITCPFCYESYDSSGLFEHIRVNHQQHEKTDELKFIIRKEKTEQPLQATIQSASNTKRKYECFVCDKRFVNPSKLQRHLIVHRDILYPDEPVKRPVKAFKHECEACGKRVETPSKLQRHLRVHDKQSKAYLGINQHRPIECPDCNLRFWDNVKMQRHQVIHSEAFEQSKISHPEGFLFTCVICLEKVPSFEECIDHMKSHGDVNSERACQLCSKVYPKLSNLIRHSKLHEENATHECIHCGKRLGMGDDLLDHLLRHQGFKPFVCEFPSCGKRFPKSHRLKQHMSSHDDNPTKNFICGHCGKKFSELDYLKRHLVRHTGQKDHKCSICSAEFSFKSELNSHVTTHTAEKLFSCDTCSAKFSKKQALRLHQKIHTGEKRYHCDQCSMRFVTNGHLTRHKRAHSGLKPFQCHHCGKSYSQSNDLIKHLRTHLGVKVYKCEIAGCEEAFAKFSELKVHKASHYSAVELMTEESYDIDSIGSVKLLHSVLSPMSSK